MGTSKAALGRLAIEVRLELGLGGDAPFAPHVWAEEYGVPFISIGELDLSDKARERFLRERPDLWSAALVRAEDGLGHLVVYNPAHSPERIRSNLTHEVAHFVAEHALTSAWLNDDGGCGGFGRSLEIEAAELAGALLIPTDVAKRFAMNGWQAGSLASRYQVSLQMAEWRMRVSGGAIIAQRARARRSSPHE